MLTLGLVGECNLLIKKPFPLGYKDFLDKYILYIIIKQF